jgi:hypothetical protein
VIKCCLSLQCDVSDGMNSGGSDQHNMINSRTFGGTALHSGHHLA